MALISLGNQIYVGLRTARSHSHSSFATKNKPLSNLVVCHYLDSSVCYVFFINETHIFDAYNLFECFYFCLLSPLSRIQIQICLIFKKQKTNKCASLVT